MPLDARCLETTCSGVVLGGMQLFEAGSGVMLGGMQLLEATLSRAQFMTFVSPCPPVSPYPPVPRWTYATPSMPWLGTPQWTLRTA